MIDKIKNKEMQGEEKQDADRRERGNLYCLKTCEIPGVGLFKAGEPVLDHDQYTLLKDHPYFSTQSPEAK